MEFIKNLFSSYNTRKINSLRKITEKINEKEKEFQNFSDEQIKENTENFKKQIQDGKKIDDILIDALANVKNACRKLTDKKKEYKKGKANLVWNMIPYDVQLVGAMILNEGKISEMKTGEGKTLVAALTLYLNSLEGKGCHLVTVNDYLAERDGEEMGILFDFLGVSIGVIKHGQEFKEKKEAYNSDITYGTNNEFGFDYLRDNMANSKESLLQRDLHFAIVDEVDSILIDEARTPLIISAPSEESTKKYQEYSVLVGRLKSGDDFVIDEKMKTVTLTEDGVGSMEKLMGIENIYTEKGFSEVHHIEQSLKANFLFKKDKDYVINDGKVVIIDEFTGRLMDGRRYGEGLHQAIEAKENVQIQRESKTLASVTFQNYFRLYKKLSGMTGTALTEAEEFGTIYGLDTLEVPTNKPLIRFDKADIIFKSTHGKYMNIASKVKNLSEKGQPVLVGTVSVEQSEILSHIFKKENISHNVLNAKFHENEAEIISKAGEKSAVTIATNMAGRGTDIKLGEGVLELGGLFILGSERHESRRIDNQLRGRAGRQGDAGETQFYISLDDDLMRIFGGEKMKSVMGSIGMTDDIPIENKFISKSIENAQTKVEKYHFDSRKHVVKYDDVMNKHREVIYGKRKIILFKDDISDLILEEIEKQVGRIMEGNTEGLPIQEWDLKNIYDDFYAINDEKIISFDDFQKNYAVSVENMTKYFEDFLKENYLDKKKNDKEGFLKETEKEIFLQTIDFLWMDHLSDMQNLREQTSLAGYGQRDPLLEYKHQAFESFKKLIEMIGRKTLSTIFKINLSEEMEFQHENYEGNTNEAEILKTLDHGDDLKKHGQENFPFYNQNPSNNISNQNNGIEIVKVNYEKIKKYEGTGRNDPCPCGSEKKYKKCCGK